MEVVANRLHDSEKKTWEPHRLCVTALPPTAYPGDPAREESRRGQRMDGKWLQRQDFPTTKHIESRN